MSEEETTSDKLLSKPDEDTVPVGISFDTLGLNNWLVKQCRVFGLTSPTPVQLAVLPPILKGRDVLACAKTGSGKTAAFALPILQKLCEEPYGIFALVITPTRELAFQISEQFKVLGKPINLKTVVITGGRDMVQQGLELSAKPHIVIATPGRLADHLESCNTFSLARVKFVVMDECDRLLDDNFGEQLQTIFGALPAKRQTLLFSATLTDTLKNLSAISDNKPFLWVSKSLVATVSTLDQKFVLCPAHVKDAYLVHIITKYFEENKKSSIMIFTNVCKYCQVLGMMLTSLGFDLVVLHSLVPQRQRLASLARFKSAHVPILLATDVASRGLDIPLVDLVINHNVPTRSKDYVHRVGRTARMGRSGQAITLVTQFDIKLIKSVENFINMKLSEYPVDEKAIADMAAEVGVARREAEIKLEEVDFGEAKEINKRKRMILEGKDPDTEEVEGERKKKGKSKKATGPKWHENLNRKKGALMKTKMIKKMGSGGLGQTSNEKS